MSNDGQQETARRTRGRPKVASDVDQRLRIVEVGRGVFLDRGFARATMDEVAARGHVSKATLYRFFANKLELFIAVVEAHRHTMLALPGDYDNLDLEEALRRIVRIDLDPAEDRERHALLHVAFAESMAHAELREIVRRHGVEKTRQDLADWLAGRMAAGQMEPDDPDALARLLMDMVFSIGRRPHSTGEMEDPEARRHRLERCIRVFLHGSARHPQAGLPAAPAARPPIR